MTAGPLAVTLFTRPECHLCDEVRLDLDALRTKYSHVLLEVDIDSDPALHNAYFDQIPVVRVGNQQLKAPISRQALAEALEGASRPLDPRQPLNGGTAQAQLVKPQPLTRSDRLYFWISKHYLAFLNLLILLYVGLPFVAPTLMKINAEVPARLIYKLYSPLCHQFGFRSFFLFGEQPYYPLKEAGLTNTRTFDQISGYANLANPYSIARLYARQYTGDPTVGYKVALCERDVATYGAIVVFGLLYAGTRRRLPALHWILWILIGLGPIGLDGFSQLFSQMNWSWLAQYLPYRESTPFLRLFTGFLFGFCTAWFAFPNIEESMRETRQFLAGKFTLI